MKKFLAAFDPRRRSEDFRRSLRNSVWSVLDYLVLPLLLLVVTPFFVFRLGLEQFGIWMLVSALTGTMGVFSFGLGDATIKYVSAFRARNDPQGMARVVRSTMTVYGALGLLTAGVIILAAPFLTLRVFKIGEEQQVLATLAFQIAGLALAARFGESIFLSALRGLERYDLAARVGIVAKALMIGSAVVLVALGYGLVAILWASVLVTLGSGVAQAVLVKWLIPELRFSPLADRAALREVFGFGFYSWLQSIAGTVFSQADNLLVGAMLGPVALAYYSVCQRMAMQIHAILSAGASFLFPLSSGAREQQDTRRLRSIYFRSLQLISVLATAVALPLILFAEKILTLWMGADFARQATPMLQILTFAYALLATSIVPYYFLNGTGHVRLNTLFAGISGVVVAGTTVLLIPYFAGVGAALAKISSSLTTGVAARTYVHWQILADRRWYVGLAILSPVALPLCLPFLFFEAVTTLPTGPLALGFGIVVSFLAGGGLSAWLVRLMAPSWQVQPAAS